jgi:ribosomal protein L11 methyltransferase
MADEASVPAELDTDGSWPVVVVEVDAAGLETAMALLAGDCSGVEVLEAGERSSLRLHFRSIERARAVLERARGCRGPSGPRIRSARLERIEDGRWVARYQASLEPFDLGLRFVVIPSRRFRPDRFDRSREPIVLVPGQAFGTGEHPTTRLCAALLERSVTAGSRWLDLGCGSGILSVVALRCGAREVGAADVDPTAATVAHDVLAGNGLRDRSSLWVGALPEVVPGRWDGVVANIELPYLIDNAPRLARLPVAGGTLIVSGFLAADEARLVERFGRTGLEVGAVEVEPPWAALVARRRSA